MTNRIAEFLNGIGIEVVPQTLDGECFLPGILIEEGRLLVDEAKLKYPGDLLHEAGHLAVAPASLRSSLSGEVLIPGADMDDVEAQSTAWAYAALTHLGLEPRVLFHEGGYRGKSEGLIFTYSIGVYPGAGGLHLLGMTATGEEARRYGVAPYPHMQKWLRD
ncbi:MAG: hypothetical protein M3362_06475 [Acidobacteriota bacterium]|nr:hypothetical protein [Acidobacteriota bacterium]